MIPWFQYCTDLWFTGFDPPKTLVPAAAMAPPVTASDPVAPTVTPQASATQDPGAKKTADGGDPITFPPPLQHAPLPTETNTKPQLKPQDPKETNLVSIGISQKPQPKPVDDDPGTKHQDSSQQGGDSVDSSNSQSSSSGDPKLSGDRSGQSNVQSGNGGNSGLPADPNQDAPNDPLLPTQNQGANPAQLATNLGSQHSSQNQMSGSVYSGPTTNPIPTETTISLGSHAVVAGPSGVHVDGVEVNPSQSPASISGGVAINQGKSIVVASQILHLPTPKSLGTTVIAGQTVVPIANGVSIQGTSVTSTSPVVISGTTVSVDKSHLYIGGNSYPLPTASPTLVVTLANGAIALPMSNAVSIYGTTLAVSAPAATISGTAISLDSSSNLIFDGTAQALPSFPQPKLKTDQATTINSVAVQLLPTGISVAGTTLTPGAPGTTVGGTLVSLGSSGSLVVGSQTVVLGAPTGSLGGLIMGGFGSEGPTANSSSTSGVVPTGANNGTISGVQSFEGKAARSRRFDLKGLAGLAVAIPFILYLHIW